MKRSKLPAQALQLPAKQGTSRGIVHVLPSFSSPIRSREHNLPADQGAEGPGNDQLHPRITSCKAPIDRWSDLASRGRVFTQPRSEAFAHMCLDASCRMADDVVAGGLDGILFLSQARLSSINLAVYRSSARSVVKLRVYDPGGDWRRLCCHLATDGHYRAYGHAAGGSTEYGCKIELYFPCFPRLSSGQNRTLGFPPTCQ